MLGMLILFWQKTPWPYFANLIINHQTCATFEVVWVTNCKWALDLFLSEALNLFVLKSFFFLYRLTLRTRNFWNWMFQLDVLWALWSPHSLFNTLHQWPPKWEPQTLYRQWQSHCGWCRLRAATSNNYFPSGAKAEPFWSLKRQSEFGQNPQHQVNTCL